MPRVDPVKLRFGPYRAPKVRYGQKVFCEDRGDVTVVRLSSGRIQWPIGKRNRGLSLVLCGDLARAVRRETSKAIQYWWGVGPKVVRRWRKTLHAPRWTPGARLAIGEYCLMPRYQAARRKGWQKNQDPERRAKISAALSGRKLSPETCEAIRRAKLGTKATPEQRAARSAMCKRLGMRPPWINASWSAAEDRLVRRLAPREATKRTGRSLVAVYMRRQKLGIQSRLRKPRGRRQPKQ